MTYATTSVVAGLACAIALASPARADQAEFQAAYAAAQQAEQQAGALRDRWTVTEDALKQAEKAAEATHYDEAVALAQKAETLAKTSIQQAREQQTAWREAVIR
jgi:hypothetical protein